MNTHSALSPADQRQVIVAQIQETQFLLSQAEAEIRRWTQERDRLHQQMCALQREKVQVQE
jgi:hypothetical protein